MVDKIKMDVARLLLVLIMEKKFPKYFLKLHFFHSELSNQELMNRTLT